MKAANELDSNRFPLDTAYFDGRNGCQFVSLGGFGAREGLEGTTFAPRLRRTLTSMALVVTRQLLQWWELLIKHLAMGQY